MSSFDPIDEVSRANIWLPREDNFHSFFVPLNMLGFRRLDYV